MSSSPSMPAFYLWLLVFDITRMFQVTAAMTLGRLGVSASSPVGPDDFFTHSESSHRIQGTGIST